MALIIVDVSTVITSQCAEEMQLMIYLWYYVHTNKSTENKGIVDGKHNSITYLLTTGILLKKLWKDKVDLNRQGINMFANNFINIINELVCEH